jgi:hypothetical protein
LGLCSSRVWMITRQRTPYSGGSQLQDRHLDPIHMSGKSPSRRSPDSSRDVATPSASDSTLEFEAWCGRRDLNPHGPCGPTDFHTRLRLSPPCCPAARFGVWTIPSPCPDLAPGVRCCPSSLYTFPAVSGWAWLGIAISQGSPTLSSSAPPVSRRALKFFRLSPMRLPIPPRPHGFKLARMNE